MSARKCGELRRRSADDFAIIKPVDAGVPAESPVDGDASAAKAFREARRCCSASAYRTVLRSNRPNGAGGHYRSRRDGQSKYGCSPGDAASQGLAGHSYCRCRSKSRWGQG